MKMRKSAILGIFFLVIFYPLLIFAVFPDKVIEDVKSSVVALYADEDLNYLRGSGFFIDSSGAVITARHVARNYPKLWALLYDGRKLELTPARFQESNDLAIILPKISGSEASVFPFLKLGNINNLTVGQPVMAIGNSNNGLWQGFYGNIENLYRQIITENNLVFTTIEFNMIIPKGFSGSPLVDENGEVLGINIANARASSGNNLSYAISLMEIKLFIKEFHKKSP
ncbi:MAG: hypothetical protein A3B89_02505 [Candidatus Buchananbacteria bacterium RIFCSPHIGHO2_02_FULL_40_13]|nr:MAG: hypothetical protein A3B89_02505 [Candidatus Buchananbacteria bacterium RIFCSPHIGHO2_02_FULL_40_13]